MLVTALSSEANELRQKAQNSKPTLKTNFISYLLDFNPHKITNHPYYFVYSFWTMNDQVYKIAS
jgi:hypothetical protein